MTTDLRCVLGQRLPADSVIVCRGGRDCARPQPAPAAGAQPVLAAARAARAGPRLHGRREEHATKEKRQEEGGEGRAVVWGGMDTLLRRPPRGLAQVTWRQEN